MSYVWIFSPFLTASNMLAVHNLFFFLYYRQQEQEQEICKNVSISNGDLFHTETVKMSSLPTKKLFECFGIRSEKGKRIDLFTNVFWAKIFHDDLFVILTKKRQLLLSIDGINFSACGPMKDLNKGIVFSLWFLPLFSPNFQFRNSKVLS